MPLGRQGRPGLLGSIARAAVLSGTAQTTTAAINRRLQDRATESAPAHSPPPGPEGRDQLADQLARLAQLHTSGELTSREFAAAKSRLLA